MNIGLVDVDGHNFPNFALMRLSAYNKASSPDLSEFPLLKRRAETLLSQNGAEGMN